MRLPSFPLSLRLLAMAGLTLVCMGISLRVSATAPGGFLENDETATVRNILSPAQISAFMPATRGNFTFPAPYNTQGIRVTQASDCGGQDCVDMIYSYWRNMSNSTGSNTMYIFVGLDKSRGGQGPTLFSYDKPSGTLTEVGPLFDSNSPLSWATGEGMFFSYSMPTKLYMLQGSQMLRYDVLSHTQETVFDTSTQYPNTVMVQASASNDDNVFTATLENATTYAPLGCVAYNVSTKQFHFFPQMVSINECQVDKSGRYVLILEQTPQTCATCDLDTVVEDLQTGQQQILLKQSGGGSHYAMGYGSEIEADAWSVPNAWRYWDLSQPLTQGLSLGTGGLTQGGLLYHDLDWNVFEPSHVSWENAVPSTTTPINKQYACGGGYPSTVNAPHVNEINCFLLDDSVPSAAEQVLVVAPTMTDMNATGGNATCPGCEGYAKDPKGNIDPTGQYFFWTSNMGGGRMDAFIVKIPSQVLTGSSGTTGGGGGSGGGPSVSITSPHDGSTVSGDATVVVTADAADSKGIASVTFQLDGGVKSAMVTAAPYTVNWDTSGTAAGTHTLVAIAVDSAGNTTTSSTVDVTIAGASGTGSNPTPSPSPGPTPTPGPGPGGGTSGGGGGTLSLLGLLALGLCLRKRVRR